MFPNFVFDFFFLIFLVLIKISVKHVYSQKNQIRLWEIHYFVFLQNGLRFLFGFEPGGTYSGNLGACIRGNVTDVQQLLERKVCGIKLWKKGNIE